MNVQEAHFRDGVADKTSKKFIVDRSSFPQRAAAVAAAAAADAETVDRDARFPQQAIDAARAQRLLGVQTRNALAARAHRSWTSQTCATCLVAPVLPPQ